MRGHNCVWRSHSAPVQIKKREQFSLLIILMKRAQRAFLIEVPSGLIHASIKSHMERPSKKHGGVLRLIGILVAHKVGVSSKTPPFDIAKIMKGKICVLDKISDSIGVPFRGRSWIQHPDAFGNNLKCQSASCIDAAVSHQVYTANCFERG